MNASALSPELRKLQLEFEQTGSICSASASSSLQARQGQDVLDREHARHVLWMLTSRDVYRMLVHESGWSADRYQPWLADTLVRLLTDCVATQVR